MKRIVAIALVAMMIVSCVKKGADESTVPNDESVGVLKVACLGASNTEGYQIPDVPNNSYPGQLRKMAGEKWNVLNAGCGGTTVMKDGNLPYWISLGYKQAKEFDPDAVIFDFGWNDIGSRNRPKMEANFVKDYSALIDEFASLPGKPRLFIILPPLYEAPNNEKAADYAVLEKYYREIIARHEITPIDLHATMATVREFYIRDEVHYSVEGCAHAAAAVYAALTEKGL